MAGAPKKWQDRVILADEHGPELEQQSAELEFKDRMSRPAAEAQAYREYRKKHHTASAAHHLRGMRAAQGSGDMDEARKHAAMYELHMGKLGEDPWREPSKELKAAMGSDDKDAAHKFKAHPGDQFVVEEHKAKQTARLVQKSLEELHLTAKAIVMLRKAFPIDPDRPITSHIGPHDMRVYHSYAKKPEQLEGEARKQLHEIKVSTLAGTGPTHIGGQPTREVARDLARIAEGNKLRPSVRAGTTLPPSGKPTKDQRGVQEMLHGASPEQLVEIDQHLERGTEPSLPPKFVEKPVPNLATHGMDDPEFNTGAASHNNDQREALFGKDVVPNYQPGDTHSRAKAGGEYKRGEWKSSNPSRFDQRRHFDEQFWGALGRSVGINKSLVEIVDLIKHFPTNPSMPVGHDLEPELESKYLTHAAEPQDIEQQHTGDWTKAGKIKAGNAFREGKLISTGIAPGAQPSKPQAALAAGVRAAPMDTKVALDHLIARGFQPETPPKFQPQGGGWPGGVTRHNVRSLLDLVPSVDGQPSFADGAMEPALPYNTGVPRSPWANQLYRRIPGTSSRQMAMQTPAQESRALDQDFWNSLNRAVGLPAGEPVSSPEEAAQMEQQLNAAQRTKKAEPPPGMKKPAGAPAPTVQPYVPMSTGDMEARKKIFASIPPKPVAGAKPVPAVSGGAPTVPSPGRVPGNGIQPAAAPAAAATKAPLPSTIPGYDRPATKGLQALLAAAPRIPGRMGKALAEIIDLVKSDPDERVGDGVACGCDRDACGTHSHESGTCNHCGDLLVLKIVDSLQKSAKLDTSSPVFTPGQLVGHEGRNLVVLKVHEGRGLGDPHLYTLRDPVDNSLSHAFEAKLTPTKEQNHG